jgi:hypothetical protein
MRIKALSPKHDRKAFDHSEKGSASQMPKIDKGHHKMKATHNAKDNQVKPFFLKSAQHVPQELSLNSMK